MLLIIVADLSFVMFHDDEGGQASALEAEERRDSHRRALLDLLFTVFGLHLSEDILVQEMRTHTRNDFSPADPAEGERTAEQVKIALGSAAPLAAPLEMEVKGRHVAEGRPVTVVLSDREVRVALEDPSEEIAQHNAKEREKRKLKT